MSYSFTNPCSLCTKKDKCLDRYLVQGAISAVHSMPGAWIKPEPIAGHFGSGTITLECTNFEKAA